MERLTAAQTAMQKLYDAARQSDLSELERDGMIQRFEFCFELVWKCGKDYLREIEGIDAASPKRVIRTFRELGYFTDEETEQYLEMADARNLTAHTYDAKLADKIDVKIRRQYAFMLKYWLDAIIVGARLNEIKTNSDAE